MTSSRPILFSSGRQATAEAALARVPGQEFCEQDCSWKNDGNDMDTKYEQVVNTSFTCFADSLLGRRSFQVGRPPETGLSSSPLPLPLATSGMSASLSETTKSWSLVGGGHCLRLALNKLLFLRGAALKWVGNFSSQPISASPTAGSFRRQHAPLEKTPSPFEVWLYARCCYVRCGAAHMHMVHYTKPC